MFKKTERTKCGNCVYWDGDLCNFDPVECRKPEWSYCRHFQDGEFVVREPAAKPAEPAVYDVWTETEKPAELREDEWWVYVADDPPHLRLSETKPPIGGELKVRVVPSPERVREALDAWAKATGWKGWDAFVEFYIDKKRMRTLLALLRSLGIDTEGL